MEEEIKVNKSEYYTLIIRVLQDYSKLSAREIAEIIKKYYKPNIYGSRQDVQPRCTELMKKGVIISESKKFDEKTKKYVSVYELA